MGGRTEAYEVGVVGSLIELENQVVALRSAQT